MAKLKKVLPIVKPRPSVAEFQDNYDSSSQRYVAGSYNWYSQLMQAANRRLQKYMDYDIMDNDVDISRALDIIADEIVGTVEPGRMHQFEVDVQDEEMSSHTLSLIDAALNVWVDTTGLQSRIFHIARNMVKYGDCYFYKRSPNAKWVHIIPRNVVSCITDQKDVTTPLVWKVKAQSESQYGTQLSIQTHKSSFTSGSESQQIAAINAQDVVRFTTCDDMSDVAPFGESVLKSVVETFKQKQLIEEAVIIYRVQRAPERRVFYIDVGRTPLPLVQQILDQARNELKQKKIPRPGPSANPEEAYDKVFDPLSTNEDYFFPVREGSRGSRVETLPGGSNVGEVSDLEIFRRKLWRGLKIPYSYLEDGSDNQGSLVSDGKTGVAYMQELKFNLMIQRLQSSINTVLDQEFKKYLRANGISVDSSRFRVKLPTPQNFAAYKQQQLDSELLQTYAQVDGIPYISKTFAMRRYLQLTQQEILENERELRMQLGLDPDDESIPAHLLYSDEFRAKLIEQSLSKVLNVPEELQLDDVLSSEDSDTSFDLGDDMDLSSGDVGSDSGSDDVNLEV